MKAIGIILAGGNNNRMKELTAKRAVPALPVAGSFRSIDFALSSMSNSHIQTVAVLTQYNARSLNEHLSSAKWWNFGRKQGGLFLFTPTVTADNSDWYRGTADAMYQNIDFLKRRHEPYVIISSGDCVYKLDFNRVLDFHIEKKSDITVVCKDMMYNDDVSRFGVVRMDDESRITEFDEKPIEASSNTISTGIYVIRRRQLIELLEAAAEENRFDFVNDILVRYKNVKKIYGYKINSYWNNIADIDAYFKTNMDFLRPDVRSYFFREEPTICSKEIVAINVSALNVFEDGTEVCVDTLIGAGIVSNPKDGVKILGNGELTKKLTVKANAFSASAVEKIEALGGKAEVM